MSLSPTRRYRNTAKIRVGIQFKFTDESKDLKALDPFLGAVIFYRILNCRLVAILAVHRYLWSFRNSAYSVCKINLVKTRFVKEGSRLVGGVK